MKYNKSLLIFKYIGVFFITFSLTLIFNIIDNDISFDPIWNFAAINKITNGFIPYKDFNLLQMPFYYFLGSAFLKLFSNNFLGFYFFNGILMGCLGTLSYILLDKYIDNRFIKAGIFMSILFCYFMMYRAEYNTLSMVFVLMLMFLETKRVENENYGIYFFIGLVLAFIVFTKQNIGIVTVLFYIMYIWVVNKLYNSNYEYKTKNNLSYKRINFFLGGFLSVSIVFCIYLLITNSFFQFFDYCILGIFDFGEKNVFFNLFIWQSYIVFFTIITDFFTFFTHKDRNFLLYGLFNMISLFYIFPIMNEYHWYMALFFSLINLGYIFQWFYDRIAFEKVKLIFNWSIYLLPMIILFCSTYFYIKDIVLDFKINDVKPGFEIYYGSNVPYQYYEEHYELIDYINKKRYEGFAPYIISCDANEYTVVTKENHGKFDFLLKGNLGLNGERKVIEELKNIEKPIFLKNEVEFPQESEEVKKYVLTNYKREGKIGKYYIYTEYDDDEKKIDYYREDINNSILELKNYISD